MEKLTDQQVRTELVRRLPEWSIDDGALSRIFETGNWQRTLLLANAIGFAAEAAGHHPDLGLSYPRLTVRLSTHDAGGITERDFALAERIETLATWQPTPGDALTGSPDGWFS